MEELLGESISAAAAIKDDLYDGVPPPAVKGLADFKGEEFGYSQDHLRRIIRSCQVLDLPSCREFNSPLFESADFERIIQGDWPKEKYQASFYVLPRMAKELKLKQGSSGRLTNHAAAAGGVDRRGLTVRHDRVYIYLGDTFSVPFARAIHAAYMPADEFANYQQWKQNAEDNPDSKEAAEWRELHGSHLDSGKGVLSKHCVTPGRFILETGEANYSRVTCNSTFCVLYKAMKTHQQWSDETLVAGGLHSSEARIRRRIIAAQDVMVRGVCCWVKNGGMHPDGSVPCLRSIILPHEMLAIIELQAEQRAKMEKRFVQIFDDECKDEDKSTIEFELGDVPYAPTVAKSERLTDEQQWVASNEANKTDQPHFSLINPKTNERWRIPVKERANGNPAIQCLRCPNDSPMLVLAVKQHWANHCHSYHGASQKVKNTDLNQQRVKQLETQGWAKVEGNIYTCTYPCSQEHDTASTLLIHVHGVHLIKHHPTHPLTLDLNTRTTCPYVNCDLVFSTRNNMLQHVHLMRDNGEANHVFGQPIKDDQSQVPKKRKYHPRKSAATPMVIKLAQIENIGVAKLEPDRKRLCTSIDPNPNAESGPDKEELLAVDK